MLLFVFLLLSTILVAAEWNSNYHPVKICIQKGKLKSVEPRQVNDTLAEGCENLHWRYFGYSYETLYLYGRNITGFEKGWYRMQDYGFRSLDLSFNGISEITSEMLNDLPASVKNVSLRRNQIERLERGIIETKHLSSIHLAYNLIHEIEAGALEKMPLLQFLTLGHNQLNNTEFAATLPRNVTKLWLNNNVITEISAGSFSNLGELSELKLGYNNITAIERQAFQGLGKLAYLDLFGNPIERVENGTFQFKPSDKGILIEEALRQQFGL